MSLRLLNVGSDFNLNEIDAFWLQRRIGAHYSDPSVAQKKAASVLHTLKIARDSRDIENRLVAELGYKLFDLIRVLREHRYVVYYRIRLVSASINDKQSIRDEITSSENPEIRAVAAILDKNADFGASVAQDGASKSSKSCYFLDSVSLGK